MKEMLLSILKKIFTQEVLYKIWMEDIHPYLEKKVQDSESKWDDLLLEAAQKLVDAFIKPE